MNILESAKIVVGVAALGVAVYGLCKSVNKYMEEKAKTIQAQKDLDETIIDLSKPIN